MSRMTGPCMCGDTQCPSCGVAQGTYEYPRRPEAATVRAPTKMPDHEGASDDDETIGPWYNDTGEFGDNQSEENEDEHVCK